nr:MFS transporter [Naumannella cuiyingiana]
MVGTSIEFYDFYIYATAAVLVFPKLFFPNADPTTQLLGSFAVFGVAFIARPLGSIIFGHLGDRIGRKGTLIGSLLTMGVATFLIGCLPTAATPGWVVLAPLCLVILRFCQGIGLGGEWSGAALLATENAPEGKRAIYGTFPQLGAPIGFILANIFFIIMSQSLTPEAFASWGWRVPFLASAVLVLLGLYVRLQLVESPAFQRVQAQGAVRRVPLGDVVTTHLRPLILGTFNMLATYVLFYLLTTFVLSFGTAAPDAQVPGLGYPRSQFLAMMIVGVVFFGAFVLVAGPLAERFGRRRALLVITAGIAVFGALWVPMFGGGFVGVMAVLIIGFSLMGLTYGPMGALLPEMFPTNVRYTGSAVSYNLASILGAAVAPFIALFLWRSAGGSPVLVGLYLSGAAVITMVSLFLTRETRDQAYETNVG